MEAGWAGKRLAPWLKTFRMTTYEITIDGKALHLEMERVENRWRCLLDGRETAVDPALIQPDVLSLLIGGVSYEVKREVVAGDLHIWICGRRYAVEVRDPRSLRNRKRGAADKEGAKKLTAPMPGQIVRVLVKEGAEVQAGQGVIVVEAMKMQNELKSPKSGIVQKLLVAEGAAVNAGDVLLVVE